jgi:hypothetical protein
MPPRDDAWQKLDHLTALMLLPQISTRQQQQQRSNMGIMIWRPHCGDDRQGYRQNENNSRRQKRREKHLKLTKKRSFTLTSGVKVKLRQLYGVYLYLRDHDMSEESNTSRPSQERSQSYLASLGDESQELADVQRGIHALVQDKQPIECLRGTVAIPTRRAAATTPAMVMSS